MLESAATNFKLQPSSNGGRMNKTEKIERAMDNIRGRFGKGAISSRAAVRNDLGIGQDNGGDERG